jgi:predicted ATPase/class 3 adenylate cyclase
MQDKLPMLPSSQASDPGQAPRRHLPAHLASLLGREPGEEGRNGATGNRTRSKEVLSADLPEGTVTLVFSDIEGSTCLLQQLGEQYAQLLADCRCLLRAAFHQWNGCEVDSQGDAFFVAFARATDAVWAAVTVQRTLANHDWPQGVSVRVRMGVHTGEPQVSSEGYVGLDVHYAARLMRAGHGGQVLLSQTTRALVEYELPQGVSLRHLGEYRLKDVERPGPLFQLDIAGLPADFPPLKTPGDWPLMERLKAYLRNRQLLLFLDNFEQVLTAAPRLSELLQGCPGLKMLVTSRAVLHVYGEHDFPVLPLPVPDLSHLPESEALAQYAAIVLFLQHAQAVKPDFQMTPANARAIAEICARLDGLPLAIELAAARVKLLSPQALLARLAHRLEVLTCGAQDVPARQQTLRNTLAWSYNLLDVEEQRLFRRLWVFAGGCTLEAVEAMYTTLGDIASPVLDRVASLIDKSLLQKVEQEREELRLLMLETIREYGLECLAASGEMEATRQAHADYYLALAEEAKAKLEGPQQAVWLEREHENLRAAKQRLPV